MEAALLSFAISLGVFAIGVRLGRKASAMGVRICLALAIIFALVSRYLLAQPERDLPTVMWMGFLGGVSLMSMLALIGPAVFERWLYALTLSVGAIVLFRVLVPAEILVCFLTGSCRP